MKDKIDFSLVGALLRKQRQERSFMFRKGNFDLLGFLFRLLLVAGFIAVFVVFFGRFAGIYSTLLSMGKEDAGQRLYELLTMAYMLILILMTLGGVSAIARELFLADDVKIFSAMPVGAKTLFIAKLVSIYRGQLLFSLATVLTVNVSVAIVIPQGVWFYCMTVLTCFFLPLVSIAIASILALPYYYIRQFLKTRFLLMFIVVTLIAAGALWLYALVLGGVKDLLLGDDIRYFFNEQVMNGIRTACMYLYPTNWLASFMLRHELRISGTGLALLLAACLVFSLFIIRRILTATMQSRISGDRNFIRQYREMTPQGSVFGALMKKEFVQIFRTPSYMFSYFSVAILMPLMVYFCMQIGAALITDLVNINVDLELALFLTLLFSALTNVFCSTNISREGPMFYSMKALSVSYKQVFFSKILFCMIVSVISQGISALMLGFSGSLGWTLSAFVFGVGVVFSFAQICFATRYDFNHARFSSEEDGEIKESGNTVSTIIVLGMLVAFLIGGAVLAVRLVFALRFEALSVEYLTYIIVSALTVFIALLSYIYLVCRLKRKYYEFSGGGLM